METVGERDETGGICPEPQQATGLSRCAGSDGGSFEESDLMQGRIEAGMAREVVCCGAADDTTACIGASGKHACQSRERERERERGGRMHPYR